MIGVYSDWGAGDSRRGWAERGGMGWNAFQDPSVVLCGYRCCHRPLCGVVLTADTLPAHRALPHFLSCERAWVWSDWHRAVPANYKTGGSRETPRGSFSCLCGTVNAFWHPSGTGHPLKPKVGEEHRKGNWVNSAQIPYPARAEPPPPGCSSLARLGPLLGRRGVGSGFFSF